MLQLILNVHRIVVIEKGTVREVGKYKDRKGEDQVRGEGQTDPPRKNLLSKGPL